MVKVRIYIILSIFLIGCNHIRTVPFNDDDLLWFNAYEIGDTCYYHCGDSVDTMIVSEKYVRKANDYHFWDVFNLKKHNWLELDNSYNGFGYYSVLFKHGEKEDSAYFSFF